MKAVHFLPLPRKPKSDSPRKPLVAARLSEREKRPGDWPFRVWPELSFQDPGKEKFRKPASRRRRFGAAHKPLPEAQHESLVCSNFAEDASKFSLPYLYLVDNILKSKKQPQFEKIKGQMMTEMIKLNSEIKKAQIQQKPQIEEIRQLYNELSHVQAENKFFLDYLINNTEEYKKQPNKLWASYLQKVQEVERRKQMSSAAHQVEIARFQTELLEKAKLHQNLKTYLKEMKHISTLKIQQDHKILALEEEKKKVPAETNAKIQEVLVPFLRKKAFLEEQLKEMDVKQLGKSKLFGKSQDLESTAWQHCVKFSRGISRENLQVQKELLKLIQRCGELEAAQKRLKTQKQQLQQKEWYLEGLVRGRKHLQRRLRPCPEEQGAPKATVKSTAPDQRLV